MSILPVLAKLLEFLYETDLNFLDKNNTLYQFQYGFRPKHSTNIALSELINTLLCNIDNGEISFGVFVDLKKAFDSVNHGIILKKLNYYGIRGTCNVHAWFTSYLPKRQQFVELGNSISNVQPVLCGIPQGSNLGPILFLLYVNDMHQSLQYGCAKIISRRHKYFFTVVKTYIVL